ncbi:FHA domain-containing protein [Candidatus Sumerlaeota bacterium]|nr:FHA domain-containing protein [Candidatus Sumerlaeota bacterium]
MMNETALLILRPLEYHDRLEAKYVVTVSGITIGRHPSNQLALPFESVSRFHAKIEYKHKRFVIVDLNSSNGCYLNGHKVMQAPINSGMELAFGNILFRCELREAKPAEEMQPTAKHSVSDSTSGVVNLRKGDEKGIVFETSIQPSGVHSISKTDPPADLAELQQSHRQLKLLYRMMELLSGSADSDDMFTQALSMMFEAVPADRGVILMRNYLSGELEARAIHGHDLVEGQEQLLISGAIVDRCIKDRVALLVRDTLQDSRFDPTQSILEMKIRSCICAPLLAGNRVMGVIFLDKKQGDQNFDEENLKFISSIANEIALALELRRRRKEVLRQTQFAAVGETVLDLAHGIKNILLVSEGGMQLLETALQDGRVEDAAECWSAIGSTMQRISSLVREMLKFAREYKPDMQKGDLSKLVNEVCDYCDKDALGDGIEMIREIERIPKAVFDAEAVRQSLENLIVNASQAIRHDHGQISVRLFRTPGRIVIEVKDNGSGIEPEHIEKIFFPRFSTKGEKGSGLGLASCRKYLAAMGGDVTVESTPDIGSTFCLVLPDTSSQLDASA